MRTSSTTSGCAWTRCWRPCAGGPTCSGLERIQAQDQGKPLAGKSTLNRLELGAQEINLRTKKIQAHPEKIEALLLARGVAAIPRKSGIIVLGFRCHG